MEQIIFFNSIDEIEKKKFNIDGIKKIQFHRSKQKKINSIEKTTKNQIP